MYRLYIKEPDEIKGHRVGEYSIIADARQDAMEMLESAAEGTFGYVYRQSADEEGKGWGPIRQVEAWQVKGGRPERIYTRWKGGEWPEVWSPMWWYSEDNRNFEEEQPKWAPSELEPKEGWENEMERDKTIHMLRAMGVENKGIREEFFEKPDWKESKRRFLERGPRTSEMPGEKDG